MMQMTPESHAAVKVLAEPSLIFRFGQRAVDPRDGLSLFGPVDHGEPSQPRNISYAAVGTGAGLDLLQQWMPAMSKAWVAAPGDHDRIWPIYPGFEAAFGCVLHEKPTWKHVVPSGDLDAASRIADPHRRASAIETAASLDESIQVVICVVPDEVHSRCRAMSVVKDPIGDRVSSREKKSRRAGQLSLFEKFDPEAYRMSVDFRRQIKALGMQFGIPLQILRESTLRLSDTTEFGERGLTPLSSRMWNIGTALYYKGGGKPWKLSTAREGVCYVGLAFRLTDETRERSAACCAAQMFLNSGDGVVFRGRLGPWYSPKDRQFHLDRNGAHDLLKGTLDTYEKLEGKPLREIFLHSRSEISDEEFAGYQAACPPSAKLIGIRVRREVAGPKLFRVGKMPVMRGTFWAHSSRTGHLFATGFKPRLGTYDGWEIPVPLNIHVQHGEADIEQVAADILGLTKLNYNSCMLGDSQPVTVGFSDAVGEILVANPTIRDPRPQFKFYI
jgi:hypothetical protein